MKAPSNLQIFSSRLYAMVCGLQNSFTSFDEAIPGMIIYSIPFALPCHATSQKSHFGSFKIANHMPSNFATARAPTKCIGFYTSNTANTNKNATLGTPGQCNRSLSSRCRCRKNQRLAFCMQIIAFFSLPRLFFVLHKGGLERILCVCLERWSVGSDLSETGGRQLTIGRMLGCGTASNCLKLSL
jgi:hypothetical protein